MYSCDREHTATRAFGTDYQPCIAGRSLHHSAQPGQVPAFGSAAVQRPRRAKKRHAARPSTSHRSSTTVVTTDVSNFRAMVQELTGFPQAAIFRPLPRRVHAANPLAAVHGRGAGSSGGGGGGAPYVHSSSDTATTAGSSSPDVPTVQPLVQQPLCAPPGVFDGLSDLGSPEFDSWADLSFEQAFIG